jgi:signal transduction histidine kinase
VVSQAGTSGKRRVPPWVIDALIALLLLSSAFVPFEAPGRTGPDVEALPWLVAAALALLLRRQWPITALVLTVVIFAAASIAGVVSPAFVIAPAISIYHVALAQPRRITVITTAATAIVLPLLSLLSLPPRFIELELFVSAQAVQLVAIIAFAGAIGDGTKSRRATLAAYEDRALRAEQSRDAEAKRRVAEDRLQIARDLHDLIAHQIAVINLHAGVASRAIPDRPGEAEKSLAVIRQASRTVLAEISDLLAALRTSTGTTTATGAGLDQLPALIRQFADNGLAVTLSAPDELPRLTAFADVVAYKVVQEALTNALKYSSDRRCTISISADDSLRIAVENTVDATASPSTGGHGLAGMRERLEVIGGTLVVDSRADLFRVEATVPVDRAPEPPATEPE